MSSNRNVNRRKLLGMIGGAATIGALSKASLPVAAHEDYSEVKYVELENKREEMTIRRKALRSSNFRGMRQYLRRELAAQTDLRSSTIIKAVDAEKREKLGYLVEIPLMGLDDADTGGITITIVDESVEDVSASKRKSLGSDSLEIEWFEQNNGVVSSEQLIYGSGTVEKDGEDIQPHFFHPSTCDICKSLYNAARSIGCGVSASALCAAAGLATAGAVLGTCTAMVPGICSILNDLQDSHDMSPEDVCDGTVREVIEDPPDLMPCA